MSAQAVREDDKNKPGSSGLGLAAAAAVVGVGLGVGAALYYFLKPPEQEEVAHQSASRADRAQAYRRGGTPSLSWDYDIGAQQVFSSMFTPRSEPSSSDEEWEMSQELIETVFEPSQPTVPSEVLEQDELDSINSDIFRQRAWTLEQCSICFEAMLAGEGGGDVWMLPCGHKFHLKCVQPWTQEHNTCPNCRKDI